MSGGISIGPGVGLDSFAGGGAASAYAPFAAPFGQRWEFVWDDFTNIRITDDLTGEPVVDLVRN